MDSSVSSVAVTSWCLNSPMAGSQLLIFPPLAFTISVHCCRISSRFIPLVPLVDGFQHSAPGGRGYLPPIQCHPLGVGDRVRDLAPRLLFLLGALFLCDGQCGDFPHVQIAQVSGRAAQLLPDIAILHHLREIAFIDLLALMG